MALLYKLLKFPRLSLYCFTVSSSHSLSFTCLIFCPYIVRSWWLDFTSMFSPHDYSNTPLKFFYLLSHVFIPLKIGQTLLLNIKVITWPLKTVTFYDLFLKTLKIKFFLISSYIKNFVLVGEVFEKLFLKRVSYIPIGIKKTPQENSHTKNLHPKNPLPGEFLTQTIHT